MQTMENKKCMMLYYEYITTILQNVQNAEIFSGISKLAVILISKNPLAATHVVQSMHSKDTINETKNKKTKKIKLRLKMLVGLQPIYLLNVLSMLSKSSCATHCHSRSNTHEK